MKEVKLKQIESNKEKEIFIELKLELVKLHQEYASKLGIFDQVVDKYDYRDAMRHFGEKGFFQFLIKMDWEIIGILEYQVTTSDIDNQKIVYIKKLYIKEGYQGKGYSRIVMEEVKKLGYRIELECWYEMPANDVYKALGMHQMKTRYIYK